MSSSSSTRQNAIDVAALTALIEKWRERRERCVDKGMDIAGSKGAYEYAGLCEALETCADDLEALLTASQTSQESEA